MKRGTWWEADKIKTFLHSFGLKDKIQKLNQKFYVCVSSGRSLEFLAAEWGDLGLSLHGEIGNFVEYQGKIYEEAWTKEETETVAEVRERLERVENGAIKGFEPKRKIISVHCQERVRSVEEIGHRDLLYCWWNGEAYDIGPKRINKLTGIKKWAKMLGIGLDEVMMVGHGISDSGAMGGVGKTVNVAGIGEEKGGERAIDQLLPE